MSNIITNPFVDCTARDMKYSEVKKFWCDPFVLYSLDEEELYHSRTPIVIEGMRGTGKTMILKYISYHVQKTFAETRDKEGILSVLRRHGLGIYFRYKDDFCNMINYLNCAKMERESLFRVYFQLYLCRELFIIMADIYKDEELDQEKLSGDLEKLFGFKEKTFEGYINGINDLIWGIDEGINESLYKENWSELVSGVIIFSDVFRKTISIIQKTWDGWENVLFSVLIDEYENASGYQQIINTYLKQVDESLNLTYRIGMRPDGMDINNVTNVAGEHLQVDRDFYYRNLTCLSHEQYKRFAEEVANLRLAGVKEYAENKLISIKAILGAKEDIDDEANRVANGDKQFELIKNYVRYDEFQKAKETISSEEKLLEMYNILRVQRGEDFKKTAKLSKEYIELRQEKKLKECKGDLIKYRLDYSSKYRMTLLYILLDVYKSQKEYYSFNTFVFLSSGAINDFISLCRNTFSYIDRGLFKELCDGGRVPNRVQSESALQTAETQLRKLGMSNHYGNEMTYFVFNMGELFRRYHQDARYPETNQFTFDNEAKIMADEQLRKCLRELINSGAVVRPERKRRVSAWRSKRGNVYQLNRIYAPIFQFSYRTRGGFNHILRTDEFDYILHNDVEDIDGLLNHGYMGQGTFKHYDKKVQII